MRVASFVAAMFLAAMLMAPEAKAQACFGNAALPGQAYIAATGSYTNTHMLMNDEAWALGGKIGTNTAGPLSLEANANHWMFDQTDSSITSVGASVAFDILPRGMVAVCPMASASYQWLSGEGELVDFEPEADGFVVAGGLGIGVDLTNQRDGVNVAPFARAMLVYDEAQIEFGEVDGNDFLQVADQDTYGLFDVGVMFGTRSVYLGPAVSFTTLDNSDPVWRAELGVVF